MNNLLNISPIDGRYHEKTKELSDFFSEYALIKYRVLIEIKWLIYLLDNGIVDESISNDEKDKILNIITNFNLDDASKVKEIENTTKHDVKACEYFLQEKFTELNLSRLIPFIHITLTSEGKEIAVKVYERHKIISSILIKIGVSEDQALEDYVSLCATWIRYENTRSMTEKPG